MPPKAAPAALSENEVLLMAVLKQVEIKGLDFDTIALETGAPNKAAAAKRWQRYYKKIMEGSASGGTTSTPTKATTAKATTAKAATTKAATTKKGAAKGKAEGVKKGGPASKKRKVQEIENEEEVEGEGDGGEQDEVMPKTPVTKKKGGRKPKSAAVVEEDDEDMEDELAEGLVDVKDGDEEELDFDEA